MSKIDINPGMGGEEAAIWKAPKPGAWSRAMREAFAERLERTSLEVRLAISTAIQSAFGQQWIEPPTFGSFGETSSKVDLEEVHNRQALIAANNRAWEADSNR